MAAVMVENMQESSGQLAGEPLLASNSRRISSDPRENVDGLRQMNGSHVNSSNSEHKKAENFDDEDDIPLLARKQKASDDGTTHPASGTSSHGVAVKTEPHSPTKPVSAQMNGLASLPPSSSANTAPVKTEIQSPPKKRAYVESGDEDDVSLSVRAKKTKAEVKEEVKPKVEVKMEVDEPKAEKRKSSDDVSKHKKKKKKKHKEEKSEKHKHKKKSKPDTTASPSKSPTKGKKEAEEPEVWKWWEEDKHEGGIKWKTLEHKGIVFTPPYEPLPSNVKFFYDGQHMKLSPEAEEVAGFYARMLEHDYTSKDIFNNNFFKDWRKQMTPQERGIITDLKKCNFIQLKDYFAAKSEERKAMTKEEKDKIKEENKRLVEEYGFCILDGHKQKVGNFRVEPPGLFRGRGDHPKMGMLKKRVRPEDVIINCSKGSKVPPPPPGHKWKEVRHDNTVTWLASWNENIMGNVKYVMLNPSSRIKGEKDWQKYEKARELNSVVHTIREQYTEDFKSKEMRVRQRAVALYFIDKLALRAGNEKEEGETADTVGCCSLRVEHLKLHDTYDDKECVVEFDFLGKDSIRYYNRLEVEKRVFKNLKLFMESKEPGDDVFDRLNTSILNKYLQSLMEGLTAKVFRTYNASHTLQEQLNMITKDEMKNNENELVLAYNRANRAVAILCNHQRAAPKTHDKQMETLQQKIKDKKKEVKEAKKARDDAKTDLKHSKSEKNKKNLEQKQKKYDTLKKQLENLHIRATDKEENKEIALGTSKLNYLDPRITIQWCLTWGVSLSKVYNKTHREKFQWAIDMVQKMNDDGETYEF